MYPSGWRTVVVAALVAAGALGVAPSSGADGSYPQDGVVAEHAIWQSPRIQDGTVLAITQAGDRIFVGGTFTGVRNFNSDRVITRVGLFAFDRHTGLVIDAFAPVLEGTGKVGGLDVSADGQWLYVGGAFQMNGGATRNLAKVSTTTGALDPQFRANASSQINDLELTGSRLIVAGHFGMVRGVPRDRLAAVDPATGIVDSTLNLPVTESRDDGRTSVRELDVSEDGQWLVVVGAFQEVAGYEREQVAVIDLTTSPVTVADWATNRYSADCSRSTRDTYTHDVAFSPDSTFFVVVTSGAFFRDTLCDTSARWEVNQTGTNLQPTWVTYTGGDTLFHAYVTNHAVYVGGHERWQNNPTPSPRGDNDGPGSVSRQGIGALDPISGVPLSWNPTRTRGTGVQAFHANDEYLYVGSDTLYFNYQRRDRLAIVPVAGGIQNPPPQAIDLPVNVYLARTDGTLYESSFNGTNFGDFTPLSGPGVDGIDWSPTRGAFVQHGELVTFARNSAYYARSFDGATLGPETNLSTSVGYVDTSDDLTPYDQPFNVDTTRTVAYANGRLYYTRTNSSSLWWRWYSLESRIIGAQEYVASDGIDWRNATGLEIAGDQLYASWNSNRLYRFTVNGPAVLTDTMTLVDDGLVSGIPWILTRDFAFTAGGPQPPDPAPPTEGIATETPAGEGSETDVPNGTPPPGELPRPGEPPPPPDEPSDDTVPGEPVPEPAPGDTPSDGSASEPTEPAGGGP
ncbi:MAG: hypothetical protein ACRD29_17650 [Acidimicrobiales bacterium]